MFSFDYVKNADPEIAAAMEAELNRQRENLELIASENVVSEAVMAAMGSHLTNKYAEGYPGKDIMAAASVWTWSRISPSRERRSCSDVSMQMYSHIPAHRPTWRYSLLS